MFTETRHCPEVAAFMPELTAEILDAAALFAAVLCWGAALSPPARFLGFYTQRPPGV
jgi:hypothetical protein